MTEPSRTYDVESMSQFNQLSTPNDDLVILVTSFLGTPVTEQSALQDRHSRFEATLAGLKALQSQQPGHRLLVAFSGDFGEAQRMVVAADLARADVHWFDQDLTLVVHGKGRLEHALITRAIQHWSLQVSNPWILKLTAKYTVENLLNTIDFVRGMTTEVCAWRHIQGRIVDTRVFAFRAHAYLEAVDLLDRIDDARNYFMEHAVYDWLKRSGGCSPLLVHRPLVSGLSGSTGVLSAPNILKRCLVRVTSMFRPLNLRQTKPTEALESTFIFVLNALKISGGVLEAFRLAKELRDSGENVLIMTMWRSPNEIDAADQLPIMRLTNWQTRVSFAAFQLPIIVIRFWWQARRLKPIGRRPIWIFTHYSTLPLAMQVPKRTRWFFVQDLEWRFLGDGISAKLLKNLILLVYRRSCLLVANAGLKAALLREGLKVDAVAPIWADVAFLQTGNENRDIDVLMVLRKGAHKRLDFYLAVISKLANETNIRIVVITTEDDIAEQVRSLVAECHVRENMAAMSALYARSKLFLHLSEHEGFGLPPLEAMGAGCVPVCRDSGGPQSYMRDALGDLLLPLTLSQNDICKVVIALLADPVELLRYSEAARRVFQEGLAIADQRAKKIRSLVIESSKN